MMNITVEMIEKWLGEQDSEVVYEIYNNLDHDERLCKMSDFDYIMCQDGYDRYDCVGFANNSSNFDVADEYFTWNGFTMESSDDVSDLIDYEEISRSLLNCGSDVEIYKEWIESLKEQPEHTEEEIKEKARQYIEDTFTDGELVDYYKFFFPDDEFYPMYMFYEVAKGEPLADVVRRLVMTLAVYKVFFSDEFYFFFVTDSAFIPWTRKQTVSKIAEMSYIKRDTLDDTFSNEFKKIIRGDF